MGTENHFQLRTGSKSSDSLEMRFPPSSIHLLIFLSTPASFSDRRQTRASLPGTFDKEESWRRGRIGPFQEEIFRNNNRENVPAIGPVRRIGYGTGIKRILSVSISSSKKIKWSQLNQDAAKCNIPDTKWQQQDFPSCLFCLCVWQNKHSSVISERSRRAVD